MESFSDFRDSPYFDSTVFSFLEKEGYSRHGIRNTKDCYYFKYLTNVKNQKVIAIIKGDAIYISDDYDGSCIKNFNFDDYRSFRGTYDQMCIFVKDCDEC